MRVLVIDDQPQVRASVCDVLRELGVSTIAEAGSGRSALALVGAPEAHFDLILCDLRMPDRDVIEVIRSFAALGVEAAVVIMSVEDDRVIEAARAAGAALMTLNDRQRLAAIACGVPIQEVS